MNDVRVVLDTNIVVSSYVVRLGAPGRIVAAWRAGAFQIAVSGALLNEYERALNYPRVVRRHRFSPAQLAQEVAAIRATAILVEPDTVPRVVPDDSDDDQVLACAVAAGADYIVSGDRHLLDLREYRGIRILSPAAFVALLDSEEFNAAQCEP